MIEGVCRRTQVFLTHALFSQLVESTSENGYAFSMLPNVKHAIITGGQFNFSQRTDAVHLKGVDLLCEFCALGALLDSNERFDPPRCMADTREAIITEILAWIYGDGDADAASMAWLFGGAGAGKSALAQTIAEICKREGRLAASFFFSRTSTSNRSDGSRLIPTLVLQLLETFPDLRVYVEKAIDRHVEIFSRSPRTHMDLLFIQPLISLKQHASPASMTPLPSSSTMLLTPTPTPFPSINKPKLRRREFVAKVMKKFATKVETAPPLLPPSNSDIAATTNTTDHRSSLDKPLRPHLIVIDGLDECNDQDMQIELLRILADAIPLLPFPLKFLIASRPEGHITRTINYEISFESLDVRRFDLGNDDNADSDIRRFLIRGFQEIRRSHPLRSLLEPSWVSEEAIETLVRKSSSHFIYAATAIKYIQYPRRRPDARLEIILGLSATPTEERPFAQLDELYTHIFMSLDKADRTTVKHVFGIFAYAGLEHFRPVRTSPVKLEEYLSMQAGDINILLEPLLSLVLLPENREDDIRILHASLLDFLRDGSRSGGLHVDVDMARDIVLNYLLREMSMYELDGRLLEFKEYRPVMDAIFNFIDHCSRGRISDDVKDYLVAFPLLYDVILHPKVILKYLTEVKDYTVMSISRVLQMFLKLFGTEGFENGQSWQTEHSMRIEKQLWSVQKGLGCDPCLLDDAAQELLSKSITFQNYHRVSLALVNMLVAIHGMKKSTRLPLVKVELYASEDSRHLMFTLLPHLSHKEVKKVAEKKLFILDEEDELELALQQRVEEYLQRIDGLAKPFEIEECRRCWGLVGGTLSI